MVISDEEACAFPCQIEAAKHGHFRHKHPGACKPCRGWGFVLSGEHFVRCRDCKGRGS